MKPDELLRLGSWELTKERLGIVEFQFPKAGPVLAVVDTEGFQKTSYPLPAPSWLNPECVEGCFATNVPGVVYLILEDGDMEWAGYALGQWPEDDLTVLCQTVKAHLTRSGREGSYAKLRQLLPVLNTIERCLRGGD